MAKYTQNDIKIVVLASKHCQFCLKLMETATNESACVVRVVTVRTFLFCEEVVSENIDVITL